MLKKKAKINCSIFLSHNTQLFPSKNEVTLDVAFVKINLFCNLSSFLKQLHRTLLLTFGWQQKEKKVENHTVSTPKNVSPLVGLFQQSKRRHLLIRWNLKFDFNIRKSTCYITTLTLLHSTLFITFSFTNITKLLDEQKTVLSFIVRFGDFWKIKYQNRHWIWSST